MKSCPIARCRERIPDRMFCCSKHWQRLPPGLREEVADAFNAYHSEAISLAEFTDVQRVCLRSIGEAMSYEMEAEQARAHVGCACRRCGRSVVRASLGAETVLFDQVRNAAERAALRQAASTVCCVVGGYAVPERGDGYELSDVYARFKPHVCLLAAAASA